MNWRALRQLGLAALVAVVAVVSVVDNASAGEIYDRVKARGKVKCAVQVGAPGFSFTDQSGAWNGLSVNFCRAVAVAMFGDKNAVEFLPSSIAEQFTQLQTGEIDIIANLTNQYSRDVSLGLHFVRVMFITGKSFMMPKALGITDPEKMEGVTACIQTGTTGEQQTPEFFRARKLSFKTISFDNTAAFLQAYQDGRCDTLSMVDQSVLAAFRLNFKKPDDHIVASQIYSFVYNGSFTSDRDPRWINVVNWSLSALIQAEELGITRANLDDLRAKSDDSDIRRFLGVNGDLGKMMGLDNAWAYNIVKQLGNYGELYEENVGPKTRVNLPRGPNRLAKDGGLLYASPFR
jgi:general L-amino acid transport system substrate-binding protein